LSDENHITLSEALEEDTQEVSVRPSYLSEFVGQYALKDNLSTFIKSAQIREKAIDHLVFYGPPGLGKTSLAHIVAKELGVGFRATSGPILSKAGDLAAILSSLNQNDVLFIDEIHRLPPAVEEILYSAMEDFKLDILIGEGPAARTIRIDLKPFTLVGATTRIGLVSSPLRDRFGIPLKLEFYSIDELATIIKRASGIMGAKIDNSGAEQIASRARGTPRISLRLLRRVWDYTIVDGFDTITSSIADTALSKCGVDKIGLDNSDHKYLSYIAENYGGGPVGLDTLSAGLAQQKDTLEDTIEPYLMQIGFLARTPKGRVLTSSAYQHLGLPQTHSGELF
jgi:holliday junction DNA helicase RuvB